MKYVITFLTLILATAVYSHEMTPAYPKLVPSFMDDIYKADMTIFNKREDVEYFEIQVFNKEWKPIPFAAQSRLINVNHLDKSTFEVYIRKKDIKRVEFICTVSKLNKEEQSATLIASRICSRVK